ncbi:hypothetical protein KBTX_01027 [wastewater metagenome]|uniref:Uncharacterized protein n=2 Tax=unclassified sequences TaxID=12908 RepID=A0A5B8R6R6_9ZZZZ|nr:hypothetical protein KBTEX_01027 [uncultured organism]
MDLLVLVVEGRVELRKGAQGEGQRLDEERHQGDAHLLAVVIADLRIHLGQGGDVHLVGVGVVRDGPRRRTHLPGHRRTHALEGLAADHLVAAARGGARRCRSRSRRLRSLRRRRSGLGKGTHVLLVDPPLLARTRHGMDVHPELPGQAPHCRARRHPSGGPGGPPVAVPGRRRGYRLATGGRFRGRCRRPVTVRRRRRSGITAARLGGVTVLAGDLDGEQRLVHPRDLALGVVALHHPAGLHGRDLHKGLVRHHVADGLVLLDVIALLDQPFGELALDNAFADIRQDEVLDHGGALEVHGLLDRGERLEVVRHVLPLVGQRERRVQARDPADR